MNTESVSLFLALLAVVAQVAVVVALVLWLGGKLSPGWRRAGDAAVAQLGPHALTFAFAVATVAMAGSLYFSEVANFPPCKLCWYQRIAMYPLVIILGVAARRRDTGVRTYVALLAVLGGMISSYHVVLERFPSLETGACDPENPCTLIWVRRFGYLTIPTMALSAFALIATLMLVAGCWSRTGADTRSAHDRHADPSPDGTRPAAHAAPVPGHPGGGRPGRAAGRRRRHRQLGRS